MSNELEIDLHGRRHSDFDLMRIVRAQAQGFEAPVTAYLCGAFIGAREGVGIVFGHILKGPFKRFDDGHFIRTPEVVSAKKEGRFWVLTTVNSRYVLATFQRDHGRKSLREFLSLSNGSHHLIPPSLQ